MGKRLQSFGEFCRDVKAADDMFLDYYMRILISPKKRRVVQNEIERRKRAKEDTNG